MICRVCSQWNPEGELRCCFCANKLAGTEDSTRDGLPEYARNVRVTATRAPIPAPGERHEDDLISQLKGLGRQEWLGLSLLLGGAIVLAIWLLRC